MSENTKIEWCDHTFNPWEGCTKVSEGCKNCYAEARDKRWHGGTAPHWGKGAPRRRTSAENWKLPMKWEREAEKSGVRPRVFCASLADWLDEEVPIEWLADLLELIVGTPNLDWLLLTKRPENWFPRLNAVYMSQPQEVRNGMVSRWLEPPDASGHVTPENVWIGVTVENQEMADKRIPELLEIPAEVRFLSCEPLLGPVDLVNLDGFNLLCDSGIDWVICGGESGQGARPMHAEWARSLRDQCVVAEVPFLFKQWGEWLPDQQNPEIGVASGPTQAIRVGKKKAGRLLDGREWNEFPV